ASRQGALGVEAAAGDVVASLHGRGVVARGWVGPAMRRGTGRATPIDKGRKGLRRRQVFHCTHCTCCKSLHGGVGALQCNDSAPTPGRWLRHLVPLPETCRTASDPAGAYGGAVTPNPAFL